MHDIYIMPQTKSNDFVRSSVLFFIPLPSRRQRSLKFITMDTCALFLLNFILFQGNLAGWQVDLPKVDYVLCNQENIYMFFPGNTFHIC